MELIGTAIGFLKCIGVPTCRYLDNYRTLEEKMNDLRLRLDDLNVRKQDIESENESEIRGGKMVKKEVEKWLDNVEKMNAEIEKIEQKLVVVSCFSRARLGKLVRKKIEEVKEIHQQGCFSDGVAVDRPPAKGVTLLTSDLEGETDVNNQIWKLLMDDDKVGMIGVCGMGGIGKTTVMKHINNQLLKEDQFHKVIWVTVSKEMNVSKVQEDIARCLKHSLPEDELERATTLNHALERTSYVLILDDVWERFSLSKIGIPDPKPDEQRKVKVVLTSRSKEVCKSMGCKVVQVKPLSKQESMNLFLNHVELEHSVVQDPELKKIVNSIVEKCGGLPLAIVTIAGSMKGVYDIHEWRNALNELCQQVKSVKQWDNEVFECLMFSYNRLADSKIQNCFVYCSLYPEDFSIKRRELIEKWIDEGFINGNTRQAMYDRGHSILNKLENNSLLERTRSLGYELSVKMHDVIRDMALSIKDHSRFYVKAGLQLKELPDEHEWTTGTFDKVSLMNNSIVEIPSHISPKCHNLSTLLLQQRDLEFGRVLETGFKTIPGTFFEHMNGLKVLDLSYTNITNLPDSISNLGNLNSLVLRCCYKLRHLPSLAGLKALKKLDLYNTTIDKIPPQMETLENLTYLALQAESLKELPTGTLPMFSRLQYLATMLQLKGEEVGKLSKLEFLSCVFLDMEEFKKYNSTTGTKWPQNYICSVGSSLSRNGSLFGVEGMFEKPEEHNTLYFVNCDLEEADFAMLPTDLDYFHVEKCDDLKCLSDGTSLFHEVTLCHIWECQGIECVINLSSSPSYSFKNIERLVLGKLCNLIELVRVGPTVESPSPVIFSRLTMISLEKCSRMKKLFSVEMLQGLQNLEDLRVEGCHEMEKIIDDNGTRKGSDTTSLVLPKLRELSLYSLPSLETICGNGVMIPTNFLRYLRITECPELKRIPLLLPQLENGEPAIPPFLKRICVKPREWWESIEWDDPNAMNVDLSTFVSHVEYF
ncbi:disease resistance protein UNI-like [Gossypium arboreum]|uniref:disease resistance protein UNI-like n=1 Tax=Gossypium arboreum TaxID=29729 RepID=UPI000819175A|nr:disease resistance protein UNI-like [Gossypium arboreum]